MNVRYKNFFGDSLIAVRHPEMTCNCLFSPSAIYVCVKEAKIVFCGEYTEVIGNCKNIQRGNWKRVFNRIINVDTGKTVFVVGEHNLQLYGDLRTRIKGIITDGLKQKTA